MVAATKSSTDVKPQASIQPHGSRLYQKPKEFPNTAIQCLRAVHRQARPLGAIPSNRTTHRRAAPDSTVRPALSTTIENGLCCAKILFSFEVDRYHGQTGKPTVYPLYVHGCLRGAARHRWTRDSGRDEPTNSCPTPLCSVLRNHPLPHRRLSTSRFGGGVWSCVPPPCFQVDGAIQRQPSTFFASLTCRMPST
jgi:hypothetical protein